MNRKLSCLLLTALLSIVQQLGVVQADVITFAVEIQQTAVTAGQAVGWNLFANVSQQSADNYGISNLSVNLFDSKGETLAPASVGSSFSNYTFFGGAFDSSNKKLVEISATLVQQIDFNAQAINSLNSTSNNDLGPLLLATGQYAPATTGLHTLSAEAGSLNSFFTSRAQFLGSGRDFTVRFESDSFTVTAVPEPSGLPLVIASLILTRWCYRPNRFSRAKVIVTDSGGLQEESTALGVPCLTMRTSTERPITCDEGTGTLIGNSAEQLRELLNQVLLGNYKLGKCPALWDGKAAARIVDLLDSPNA